MMNIDNELAEEYLNDSRERLAAVETDLLAIGNDGQEIDEERLNRVLQAVHSVRGGAGVFDLPEVTELAQQTENVLDLMRSRKTAPTPRAVSVLLSATDKLHELIQDPGASHHAGTTEILAALAQVCADQTAAGLDQAHQDGRRLRMLLVEDDFSSRILLQMFLSHYGDCHVAVNGREAVEAVRLGLEQGRRYDLICMDIMMPEMNGREAVREVRALEEGHGILSTAGAKIIMTTAVDDVKEVIGCFKELCDGYLVKPIDRAQLINQMRSFQLVR
jgi:two-component system chemotaxis response regulator CheY